MKQDVPFTTELIKEQQSAMSFAIDNHQQLKSRKVFSVNFLSADNSRIQDWCFYFFSQESSFLMLSTCHQRFSLKYRPTIAVLCL